MLAAKLNWLLPEYHGKFAVIANGLFPEQVELLAWIRASTKIFACDGVIHKLQKCAIIPDYLIGDGDSAQITQLNPSCVRHPYILIADQNTNDLTKALNFVAANYGTQQHILLYGATGLREDHALANIALFAEFSQQFSHLVMLSDYGVFRNCQAGTTSFPSLIGQQISFFSFDSKTEVSCQELKWPLKKLTFSQLNHGTLNQANSTQLTITSSAAVLLYQAFEIK